MKLTNLAAFTLLASATFNTWAQVDTNKIEEVIKTSMARFDVPGMAVAIVENDEVVLAKGFGIANLNTKAEVNKDTLFGIASNTKAFTSAALAKLVDEGKLRWDDRVIDHLPEFRLYDSYVTREMRVRDLLSHRSGLGLGQGDLIDRKSVV